MEQAVVQWQQLCMLDSMHHTYAIGAASIGCMKLSAVHSSVLLSPCMAIRTVQDQRVLYEHGCAYAHSMPT